MIEIAILTGVLLFFCIKYFIIDAKGNNVSSIQTEQRRLLEAHTILKRVTSETVSPPTQQQYNQTVTITECETEEVYHIVSENTSLVVYSPAVEQTSFFPFVYLGFLVALYVLVFLISKWLDETERKQRIKKSLLDACIKRGDSTRTLGECVELYASSDEWFDGCEGSIASKDDLSEEWFDACEECSISSEDDLPEEWFDACEECTSVCEDDVSEEWFDAYEECSCVNDDDVSEEWFEACEECNDNVDDRESGVFKVSNEVSSEDKSENVLIAFGDFSLQQTKEIFETKGFVLTLPESRNNANLCSLSNQDLEISAIEKKLEENEKQEKESGINTFKTDLQISETANADPFERELQRWEPVENDEAAAELECLEKEGTEDLKDDTILSPEKMYELNPDVKSTFQDDLSQYTTKLDMTTLSSEQIEFAEKMADEIMKENKQRKNKQRRKNSKRNHRNY